MGHQSLGVIMHIYSSSHTYCIKHVYCMYFAVRHFILGFPWTVIESARSPVVDLGNLVKKLLECF